MKAKVLLFAMLLSLVACGEKTNVQGVVVRKYVKPARTTYQTVFTGNTVMVLPFNRPQEHIIIIDVDTLDKQYERVVGYDLYNSVSVGDSVIIELVLI